MIDTPDWYIHYDWYTWLILTLWLIHLFDTYNMTGVSIIVYVSTRWINHSACINHSGWITHSVCINHSGCFTQSHTLWLIHLIHTYTMIDTPDWYIHYDWYTWLILTLWLIHLFDTYSACINHSGWITHSVCINHSGCFTQCMYQSGVSIHSICINQVCHSVYASMSSINHSVCILVDTYTMIDTPDWYIHWVKHPLWLIHTLWLIHLIDS
jgi:hypothetical protein